MTKDISAVPCLFGLPRADRAALIAGGHINSTYDVTSGGRRYILQSVNTDVFEDIPLLEGNMISASRAVSAGGIIDAPAFMNADNGFLARYDGAVWRMWPYILSVRSPSAYDTGFAFGSFIRAVDGAEPFVCAKHGFHDTEDIIRRAAACGIDMPFIDDADIHAFDNVPKRNIHGDAKTDNCIVSHRSAVIDLDTVMTHYAAYDYGDMVRSVCRYSLDRLKPLTEGFAAGLGGILAAEETDSLYSGVICITEELAVRYLLMACGQEDLGSTPARCTERVRILTGQLSLFRQNERFIRDTVRCAFGR